MNPTPDKLNPLNKLHEWRHYAPPVVVLIVLIAWALAMISVPIQRWISGDAVLPPAISLGVFLQVVASVEALLVARRGDTRTTLLIVLLVVPAAWWVERIGSTTGFPFGAYTYTTLLQPQIGGVPLMVPFAWLMMLPPSWAVAAVLTRERRGWCGRLAFVGVSTLALTAWDLFLDPQMVKWDLWRWSDPGAFHYFGIPWSNYAGWLLAGAAITVLVMGVLSLLRRPLIDPSAPLWILVLIYAITWALQSIGQWVFWGLPNSGSVGFVVMGIFVIASARRLWIGTSARRNSESSP